MPIQIQVPGKGIAEFPDDVPYDKAFEAIREDVPDFQPSREDAFNAMRQRSEAFAAADRDRFLKDQGDSSQQVAYERMAGNIASGTADTIAPFVRLLERPLDSYRAGERRYEQRFGLPRSESFEEVVRKPFDESSEAAAISTAGRGNTGLNILADVVGGIAPNVAATTLTGGIGGAFFSGVQQAGSSRKRILDHYKALGLPEEDAQNEADLQALASGASIGLTTKFTPKILSKVPVVGKYIGGEGVEGVVNSLLAKQLRQSSVGEIAKKALGEAFGEATEEGIGQFIVEVIESKRLEPNLSWEEIALRTAKAAGMGALGGGLMSGVSSAGRKGLDKLTGYTPPTDFELSAMEGRFANAKRTLDLQREARNNLDSTREQSANELAAMVGMEQPHSDQDIATRSALASANAQLANQISPSVTDSGFFETVQPGGPGLVQMMRESEKRQRKANVQSGLVGPATSYVPEYAGTLSQSQTDLGLRSGSGEPVAESSPVDEFINLNRGQNTTAETTLVDAAMMSGRVHRKLPPAHPEQQAVFDSVERFLDNLEKDPNPNMTDVVRLEQIAPAVQRVINSRIDKAIELNATNADVDYLINLQSKLKRFTDDVTARRTLLKEQSNAIPIQEPTPGVPRQRGPQVELQGLGQGDTQPQVVTGAQTQSQGGGEAGIISQPQTTEGGVSSERQGQEKGLQVTQQTTPPKGQPAAGVSLADKVVAGIESIEKNIRENTYSVSDPFTLTAYLVTKAVLGTTKAAIRAGQSVHAAIRSAIDDYRARNPKVEADYDWIEKTVLADLQPFLSGQEEPDVIAQSAAPIVEATKMESRRLDEESLGSKLKSKANEDLRNERDVVLQKALAAGMPASDVPKNPRTKEFSEFAESIGHDTTRIDESSSALNAEDKANELAKLTADLERVTNAENALLIDSPTKHDAALKWLSEASDKLRKRIAGKGFDPVRPRAAEISSYNKDKVAMQAKRNALSNANVVAAITGPVEELRSILEEDPALHGRTPSQMLADPFVSDDAKQNAIVRMSVAFREFDYHRELVEIDLASKQARLDKIISTLEGKISDAEMERAYADIVMDHAAKALSGEVVDGGVNPKWVEWFDNNQSQIRSFARTLATRAETDTNARSLLDWMIFNPEGSTMPDIRNMAGNNWGVGDEILKEIKQALAVSPAIRNAVASVHSAGTKSLEVHELRAITTAALGGDEELANELFSKLTNRTQSDRAKLIARAGELKKQLDNARLELETLKEAKSIFDKVAGSQSFIDGRGTVEKSDASFSIPFLVRDEKGFNVLGFKFPGGETQPKVRVLTSDSGKSDFSKEAGKQLLEWSERAKAYVNAYESAQSESQASATAPTPTQLGFDPAVYRGLKIALEHEVPILLDGSIFDPRNAVDYSGTNQLLQTLAWFSQLDLTSKLIRGVFGKGFQQSLLAYRDANMRMAPVMNNPRFTEMPMLLSKAMAKHPSVGATSVKGKINELFAPGANFRKYRDLVFNPMATVGRGFGQLRVGTVLWTGEVVTQEDIDLLQRAMAQDNAFRKVAQNLNKGQAHVIGGREFRRQAASVGDMGTPRNINNDGYMFMAELAAMARNLARGTVFDLTDLKNGEHGIVSVWNKANRNHGSLTAHVEDSAFRNDRDIAITPYMRQAYRKVAEDMRRGGYANPIASMEDLATRLIAAFPSGTGLVASDYVLEQLNAEFDQYSRNAISTISSAEAPGKQDPEILDASRGKSATHIEVESSQNEFTKPAGKLRLPSNFYDYSSINSEEQVLAKSRAISERLVEMKNAMVAALDHMNKVIDVLKGNDEVEKAKIAAEFGGDVPLALAMVERSQQALKLNIEAIGRDYTEDPAIKKAAKSAFKVLVGGVLTRVGTAVMNIASSPGSAFVLQSKINRAGASSVAFSTARFGARTVRNVFFAAIDRAEPGLSKQFKKAHDAIARKSPRIGEYIDRVMRNAVVNSIVAKTSQYSGYYTYKKASTEVQGMGFSQFTGFFGSIANSIRDAVQYIDSQEEIKSKTPIGRVKKTGKAIAKTALSTAEGLIRYSLLELGDLAINSAAIQESNHWGNQLKPLAIQWASDRIAKGMKFDPSNPEFLVRPDEYRPHGAIGRISSEDTLAHARQMANMAGTTLEQMLWDYNQRSEGGKKDVSFFGEHDESVKRVIIGDINSNTGTNRPTKSQTSSDSAAIAALTGFSSNMAGLILDALKGSNRNPRLAMDRLKRNMELIRKLVAGLIAFLGIGLFADAARDWMNRFWVNKINRRMTAMDKEFWTPDAKLPFRLAKRVFDILPYMGGLSRVDEGFRPDVAGSVFLFSSLNSLGNYAMGLARMPVQDWPWLAKKFARQWLGFAEVPAESIGYNSPSGLVINGVAAYSSAIDAAGLAKPSITGGSGMPQYSEKTGMLSKLNEASMNVVIGEKHNNPKFVEDAKAEIQIQKDRLTKYHVDKIKEDNERRGIEMSEDKVAKEAMTAVRRDWQNMNPITRALGHAPTENEMDRINAKLSGDRRAAADLGWQAYQRMSDQFPNAKGATPVPTQVAQRRGGGSRFGYSPLALAMPRGRSRLSRGRRMRFSGVRSRRTGSRRGFRIRR